MAAGNSGDIQMNGNVDWNAIAKQTLRYQYDAKRASVCLWFILFFFNAEQRREAANQWESLWHDLSFVEQMALPQPASRDEACSLPSGADERRSRASLQKRRREDAFRNRSPQARKPHLR
ncbi:hypothetical protein [Mesosutterella multiformis]|uniref:hypothetical protein n=1 Tax=Mesosutterella multiformis TaxID=2259133 RepID=UPI000F60E6D9|nr:hypothetical protein [Mesosutterella multiformis]